MTDGDQVNGNRVNGDRVNGDRVKANRVDADRPSAARGDANQGGAGRPSGAATGVYLPAVPLAEARARFEALVDLRPLGPEELEAPRAIGRVTAGPILAALSSPHYHASAMDGYALRAESTYGASETAPVRLAVRAGALTPAASASEAAPFAIPVDTGDPLPLGCDAVVPVEDAIAAASGAPTSRAGGAATSRAGEATAHRAGRVPVGPDSIELRAAAYPWQHVRVQGEDIVSGQVLFGENHQLSAADVGLLLTAGVTRVAVRRRPVVTIIPTGDEIVSPLACPNPAPGQILETNGTVARLTLETWGAVARLAGPVPDDPALIGLALDDALASSDLVLLGAGSSAGRGDFTALVVAERGQVAVHGVAMRPGKPVVLGVARGKPVIGLPGYPVSSALALDLFVRPLVHAWQGLPAPRPERLEARLGRPIPSPLGVDEFVRVKVARVGGGPTGSALTSGAPAVAPAIPYVAVPLPRGAGLLSALSQADGTVRVPANREGLDAGEVVPVELSRPRSMVDRALLVTGSHDLLLDLLSSRLAARDPALSLSAGRAGSLGGLLALRDGLCHLAGTHLLDEASGDYNRPWVERLLPGRPVHLLTLAWRQQGLMVRPGNPKRIAGLGDLYRSGVVFINRQRGSGTRVLLDYLLGREGLDPTRLTGYEREEGSHLGVASAVASGAADAGLGIQAAARALGLDFIPVAEERYDLAFLAELEDDSRLGLIRDIVRGDAGFHASAVNLGGYDLRDTGKEVAL